MQQAVVPAKVAEKQRQRSNIEIYVVLGIVCGTVAVVLVL